MSKFIVERDPDCPPRDVYCVNKQFLTQKGLTMPHPTPQVRRILKTHLQFQNGEIEIVQRFRAKIGKESFKGAMLRLMKEATK